MSIYAAKTLILASSSPRRQELIQTLGLPYEIRVSDVNEDTDAGMSPAEIVEQLSIRKARAVSDMYKAEQREEGIVIGSDTIVVLGEEVLGKPRDQQDAARMLDALQGKAHHVFSGVACIDLKTGRELRSHMVSKVTFRAMSEEEIWGYVQTGEPLDKAGAYGVQGLGAVFIEKIEGDFYNIMGLPLNLLYQMLLKLGISLFGVKTSIDLS
jgi:septum formation protein